MPGKRRSHADAWTAAAEERRAASQPTAASSPATVTVRPSEMPRNQLSPFPPEKALTRNSTQKTLLPSYAAKETTSDTH